MACRARRSRAIRDEAGALGAASVARPPPPMSGSGRCRGPEFLGGPGRAQRDRRLHGLARFRRRGLDVTADVFGTAPRELTCSISLAQTLDLLRTVVDVVEEETEALAPVRERAKVREAVLRYSREVAFGAATVYAQAAESRGAWDARLESVVVDAVLRGEADQSMPVACGRTGMGSGPRRRRHGRGRPTGRGTSGRLGTPPGGTSGRRPTARCRPGGRVVVILGGVPDPLTAATVWCPRSARARWSSAPRSAPVRSRPQRAPHSPVCRGAGAPATSGRSSPTTCSRSAPSSGTPRAQRWSAGCTGHCSSHRTSGRPQPPIRRWSGSRGHGSCPFVHANTVRYRLGAITRETGLDLADPTMP